MTTAEKKYIEMNGTSYTKGTPERVMQVLEGARIRRERIRVFYGDVSTGRDWMEEHDTIGYIGRSTGTHQVPLLIKNNRSIGGGAVLTDCIVKITEARGGRVLYEHPEYHHPQIDVGGGWNGEEENYHVYFDGNIHASFGTYEKADRWADFIKGKRNNK